MTFDLNYDGAESIQVEADDDGYVTKFNDPYWDGYIFTDRYTSASGGSGFDYDTPITQDTTVYAQWEEAADEDTCRITFYWNYDGAPDNGVYTTSTIKKGRKVAKPNDPEYEDHTFINWYTDADCTTLFDFTTTYSENTSVYAQWYDEYVFEAEHLDFTGRSGNGFSGNANELEMVIKDTKGAEASNGYYVSYLYYNGCYLDFYINADEAIDNVILTVRWSVEFYDIESINSTNYGIYVNGLDETTGDYDTSTEITGYNVALTGAYDVSSSNVRAFEDYEISTSVSLNKGANIISFVVENNTSSGGTLHAQSPMFDCIKLSTDNVGLSWNSDLGYPMNTDSF